MTRGGEGRGDDHGGRGGGQEQPRSRSAAEWITLAISTALILAVVGLVAYLTFAGGDRPPVVAATPRADAVRREGGRYYLPVVVTNRGDQTAEAVVVRADLTTAGTPESAEFTIDFLAGGETAEGTVAFSNDPSTGELAVGVASFR